MSTEVPAEIVALPAANEDFVYTDGVDVAPPSPTEIAMLEIMQVDVSMDWPVVSSRYLMDDKRMVGIVRSDAFTGMQNGGTPAAIDLEYEENTINLLKAILISTDRLLGRDIAAVFLNTSDVYTCVAALSFFDLYSGDDSETALDKLSVMKYLAEHHADDTLAKQRAIFTVFLVVMLCGTAGATDPKGMAKELIQQLPIDKHIKKWIRQFDFSKTDESWAKEFCLPPQ